MHRTVKVTGGGGAGGCLDEISGDGSHWQEAGQAL